MERNEKVTAHPVDGGAPIATLQNVEISTSGVANVFGLVCFPLTLLNSWWVLNPREEAVVINCGVLTDRVMEPGCHFNNCFGREIRTVSVTQQAKDLMTQKITDLSGNPILISAVLTYRVTNSLNALLNVKDVDEYVGRNASATLKSVCSLHSYEELKKESGDVQKMLVERLQPLVDIAGVTIQAFVLNELNYAPEIASQMLRKQAAQALVDARHLIVKGACDIAENAVSQLEAKGLKMTSENKFSLVSSLLIITAGDKEATPTLALQ